jgi:hypothetical protein
VFIAGDLEQVQERGGTCGDFDAIGDERLELLRGSTLRSTR